MTKNTIFLVKQTQPSENYINTTFAIFGTFKEAEKCRKHAQKEWGNEIDPDDDWTNCHFYSVEESEVKLNF